jgi:pheromone shutdown-related protein TraB
MGEIRIVGTAHVSQKSVDEVKIAIDNFKPDIIAIELDEGRYRGLKQQQKNPEIEEILEAKNFTELLIQWILAYIQRKIGMDVGVDPGSEMKAAIAEAEERKIPLAMIDRDIRVTLNRFWSSMPILEKLKMFSSLITSLVTLGKDNDINIDELSGEDFVHSAMTEFHSFAPCGANALITERDAYMTHKLIALSQSHNKILAVVGAGHKKGIENYLTNPENLPQIEDLITHIKTRPWGLIVGTFFVGLFVILILAIVFSGVGWQVLATALLYWVLIHGFLTFIFTLIAGGHPLSALVGLLISPFSSLKMMIPAGWCAAIAEAKIRKPKPSDMKKIFEAESISDMRKVPLFKVVLVAVLGNVGSTIGTILFFIFIFPILGINPGVVLLEGLTNLWQAITSLI